MAMLPGAPDTMQPMIGDAMAQLPQIQAPKRGGMFGGMIGGDAKMFLLAALSGLMARKNPQGAQMIQQAMMLKQRQKSEDQQYQRERQDKFADFKQQYDYKAAHPDAPAPTEYERMLSAAGYQPGTPEYLQHVRSYVNMKENPPYFYTDPTTGAVSMIPRQAPQPAPPGVTFTPIDDGGPTPQASGGFPRPY